MESNAFSMIINENLSLFVIEIYWMLSLAFPSNYPSIFPSAFPQKSPQSPKNAENLPEILPTKSLLLKYCLLIPLF